MSKAIPQISFSEYLSNLDFIKLYDSKILPKKGGGRDHISPKAYKPLFIKEIDAIKERCLNGNYHFSPYNEKLVLKGRDKYPRVLSVPTVRDRFVLSLLNGYLSKIISPNHEAPNKYIYRLTRFINESFKSGKKILFFKTDISSFYDNICHTVLIRKLADRIDCNALKLIIAAITTPTIADSSDYNQINQKGVPQGLSISNILASLYMEDFHNEMSHTFSDGLFLRYVDDIIVLHNTPLNCKQILQESLTRHNLGLELTQSKTKSGELPSDSFDYIGYIVKGDVISIKKRNIDKFADKVIRRCIHAARQYTDIQLRPRYIQNDHEYLEFTETDLNLFISGFRVANHNYGWIAYFQQMNDLTILYQLDKAITKHLGKELLSKIKIHSLVKTYHDIKYNMGRSILINFDTVTERGKMIAYLKKFGFIKQNEEKDLSDDEVKIRFDTMIQGFIRRSERDLKELS